MSTSSADYKFPAGHDFFSNDGNHSDLDLLTEIKVPPPLLLVIFGPNTKLP
jgi:hypothetical protein